MAVCRVLLFLCLLLSVFSSGHAIVCPPEVRKTIDPGKECTYVNYEVNGKPISEDTTWEGNGVLRPGRDCFPPIRQEYEHTRGDETCTVMVNVTGVCSWHPNHCWPGDCTDNMASACTCRQGFVKYNIYKNMPPGVDVFFKRCKWTDLPELRTCRVAVTDSQGHSTNSSNSGSSTSCSSQQDEYIRTQPRQLYFVFKAHFSKAVGPSVAFVADTKIGIVEANISVVKVVQGSEVTIMDRDLSGAPLCQRSVSVSDPVTGADLHDCETTLTLPQAEARLQEGERLCAKLAATAGGQYRLQDDQQKFHSTATFPQTSATKRVCFTMDTTKPEHCITAGGVCTSQPLTLSTRLSRSPRIKVKVNEWTDPQAGGSASGLGRFRLEVHGVDTGRDSLTVQPAAISSLTQEWDASSASPGGPYEKEITLPEEGKARLYAVMLEVHDLAGNVAYARRLVLLDSSSSVQLHPARSLTVVHADQKSHKRWQTDVSKDLCVTWTDRFFNSDLRGNNLLARVSADLSLDISGQYDQTSGPLPVQGTPNLAGITRFEVSWKQNGGPQSAWREVTDLTSQNTCLQQSMKDGDTYDVTVRASDIMNNSKEDSVKVSIDHTPPLVKVQGLRGRWNRDGLHVHNSTDLSTMTLVLRASDPHSGLTTLHWTLSTRPLADDVGRGAVAVQRLDNTTSCIGQDNCYCPSVGACETDLYLLTFTSLVAHHTHQGDHHRHYHVTLTATNGATLSGTGSVRILLDESPPTAGVVWEGLAEDGQAEMDFTSSAQVHVRWHGYQDPESGILLYRVVMGRRCMSREEVEESGNATEVKQGRGSVATFTFPAEGLYFFSVVAYNGALAPSRVVCSDGVTYDTTPPSLRNVTITHARGGRMLGCTQPPQAWLVQTNLTRVAVHNATACQEVCSGPSPALDVEHLPKSSLHVLGQAESQTYCQTLPKMSADSVMVLPSDFINITWQGQDEESQIEEYFVGLGSDVTSSTAPDILPFTSTHGHPSYHVRHAGLGQGDRFFLVLQVLSKAGLRTARTLGPVLIDVTAPKVTQALTAGVEDGLLLVTWHQAAFADPEQPPGVDFSITFRVGHDGGFVTAFRPVSQSNVSSCQKPGVAGCAYCPVRELAAYDTQDGRSFFFQIHVVNAAGHLTSVNTSSVRLPSHLPPGHAVIVDVIRVISSGDVTTPEPSTTQSVTSATTSEQPTSESLSTFTTTAWPGLSTQKVKRSSATSRFSGDVDAIVKSWEVCVAWTGFHHEEEVRIEVGVGTQRNQDDVIKLHPANSHSPVCLNMTSAPVNTKLFSVVRATSSGGAATFSSDGFVIVSHTDSERSIHVFSGKGCHDNKIIGTPTVEPQSGTVSVGENATIPVHAGDFLFVQLSPFTPGVIFKNATLMQTTFTGYQLVAETPNITAVLPQPVAVNTTLHIQRCQKNSPVIHPSDRQFTCTWETKGSSIPYVKYFNTQIIDTTCLKTTKNSGEHLKQECTLHEEKTLAVTQEVTVYRENLDNNFLQGHSYVCSVSPCFDDVCLPAVMSQPVIYDVTHVDVQFQKGRITDMNIDLRQMTVDAQASTASVPEAVKAQRCGYMWAISADRSGSISRSGWTVHTSPNCSSIQIKQQVSYRGNGRGTLYICLRLLFPVKLQHANCFKLSRSPKTNGHNPYQVLELSQSSLYQTDFQPFLSTPQLGSKLHQFHDLDLDFAPSHVMLSAILTNSINLNVTWFLMTSPRAQKSRDCAGNEECVTSKEAKGQVTFSRYQSKLQSGNMYYICASFTVSPDTPPQTQTFHYVCGDGVVIDDVPPVKGSVTMGNVDSGYLAGSSHVTVSWSGFSDVETSIPLLRDSVTLNFSVALGSYPGAEDLVPFVQVGQRTSWTFDHLVLPSGVTCVATVRAQDRVGHVTEAWSNQVMVDSTPPVVGDIAAGTVIAEDFVPGHELPVHWEGVEDKESGLFRIEVGVAEAGGGDNVVEFQTAEGSSAIVTDRSGLTDGHAYVALLKVTNKAGLTTIKSSAPFVIDSSPPSPGHLWHSGSNTTAIIGGYSRLVGVYSVKWTGFTDPHSGIDYYRVGLGSSPGQADVVPLVYVGRQTSYSWRTQLEQGTPYYAVLQACNRAGLCRLTSSHSLIFDDSPPTSGHVSVGLFGRHEKFLGHNSSVPVQWRGFSDPQTGIRHFAWCVGQRPRACDVIPSSHTLLSRAVHKGGVTLPLAKPLYVSVTATNPVGLATISVSHSFVVDTTPPEVIVNPQFLSRDGKPVSSQWDRSVLHLAWLFRDPESSVVSHTVYIRSQRTGRLVCDPLHLGPHTQLTLPLGQSSLLTDGDRHWASVSACNAAHLCVIATSDVILIDSTPPLSGTFLSPLTWKQETSGSGSDVMTIVDLRWREFTDTESNVTGYEVIAGRRYNGEELSGGRIKVGHNSSTPVQQYRLEMKEALKAGDVVHVAVLAENSLHLRSPLVRVAFDCLLGNAQGTWGSLELIRHSCNASYCTGECTCAAAGKVCRGSFPACTQLNSTDPSLSSFQVLPSIGSSEVAGGRSNSSALPHVFLAAWATGQRYLTSSTCLEGRWSLSQPQSLLNISRFEYSFSLADRPAGEGVFDTRTEPVWYDVGRDLKAVHCLPRNRTALTTGHRYVLHVRVWPSRDSHVSFVSSPLMLDHSGPQVRRGRAVLDSDQACSKDLDYVTAQRSEVTACWNGVFGDAQSDVVRYQLWIGTSPKASNHLAVTDVGLNTSWTLPTKHLEAGTRYYVTVRAWNGAGLQTTAVSDGFLLDLAPPVTGVVFPSRRYGNRHAQSSTSEMWASWHGFEDGESGVRLYQVAVVDAEDAPVLGNFSSVGMKTEVHLDKLALSHKHRYTVAVKAVDAAGLESPVVQSHAILVDVTPPEGVTCSGFEVVENVTLTPSLTPFHLQDVYKANVTMQATLTGEIMKLEMTASRVDHSVLGYLHLAELKMPLSFHLTASGVYTAQHTFLSPYSGDVGLQAVVEGPAGASLVTQFSRCLKTLPSSQDVVILRQTSAYSLSVCSHVRDLESGLQALMVGVGTTPGGLQLQPWTAIGYSGHLSMDVHVQHATTLYAVAVAQNYAGQWSRFVSSPVRMDKTGPVVSNVMLTLKYEGEGQGKVTEVWAEGKWSVQDAESGVEVCSCSFGGQQTNQSTLTPAGHVTKGQCRWQLRDPRHGSKVIMSVTCHNKVQLYTTVTSQPARILLNPPVMTEVTLGSLPNSVSTSPYDQAPSQVRSANSSLQFFWRGVRDPTVRQFYFRFLLNSAPLGAWSLQDAYKTTAVFSTAGHSGVKSQVTAQLMAVNQRNVTSEVMSAVARLDDTRPLLTGKKATSAVNKGKEELSLDWRDVFHVTRDVTYSVYAGTERGYGDVINHVVTKETRYTGYYAGSMTSLHVTIQAVTDNGLLSEYAAVLDLS